MWMHTRLIIKRNNVIVDMDVDVDDDNNNDDGDDDDYLDYQ